MGRIVPIIALLSAVLACSNQPPELRPLSDLTGNVGTRMDVELLAYDADASSLDFDYRIPGKDISNRAALAEYGSKAVFSWTPIAEDVGQHQVDFSVSDGTWIDVESVIVTIRANTNDDNAPRFVRPLGEGATLDLSLDSCITVDIEVVDPDSANVDIYQSPEIPLSSIEGAGNSLSAFFHWCPSPEQQLEKSKVLTLVADDHDNLPVYKTFTILIRDKLPTSCPGAVPIIEHVKPADLATLEDIKITASVTDAEGLAGAPIVYYAATAPTNPPEGMSPLAMEKVGSNYAASIPNPALTIAAGQSVVLYYVIVAEDDDDKTGSCDHRTVHPDTGTHQITITRPAVPDCQTTKDCSGGQICSGTACVSGQCTPSDDNGDHLYAEQSTCPADHFCPSSGPSVSPSQCALDCATDTDCGAGTVCKVFDTKRGCGQEGSEGVGAACGNFSDCSAKAMCLPWTGGYCSLSDCSTSGILTGPCPTGSVCYPMPDDRFIWSKHWICVQSCTTNTDCRSAEGYSCKAITDDEGTAVNVCLP